MHIKYKMHKIKNKMHKLGPTIITSISSLFHSGNGYRHTTQYLFACPIHRNTLNPAGRNWNTLLTVNSLGEEAGGTIGRGVTAHIGNLGDMQYFNKNIITT
jgi:hypothetical protein